MSSYGGTRKICQGYGKPKKGPPPATLRSRPRAPSSLGFFFPSEASQHVSLMRHGWYRRKMRKERPDEECYW